MDLLLLKFHLLELVKLIEQEPNNPLFGQIYINAGTLLNSHPFNSIKDSTPLVPIFVLQSERKRRQAIENLLKRLQKHPDYPDEVKSDIAKALQETMREYKQQIQNLRQKDQQESSEAC